VIDGVGGVGEVMVRGAHVVGTDDGRRTTAGGWHRTSDIARLDEHGRMWLLGRVGEEISDLGRRVYPGVVEAAAASAPGVLAAGFVAHDAAVQGELALEIDDARHAHVIDGVRTRLARIGLDTIRIRVVSHVPMDARHDSKVDRAKLARLLVRSSR
jgi:acyl-coenzyme A synthetase/AMP-(fatty) acid ligase